MDIATLGVEVASQPAVKGAQDLDRLGDQAAVTEQQVTRMAVNSNRAFVTTARGARGLSSALQGSGFRNVTLQLNQVVQQTIATGDAFKALAIQFPDLLLGFGTLGVVASAAGGLLLPLAADLFDLGDASEKADEQLDGFLKALDLANGFARLATQPIKELKEEFGEFADEVRRGAQIAAQAALAQAVRSYGEAVSSLQAGLDVTAAKAVDFQRALDSLATTQSVLGERTVRNAAAFESVERSVEQAKAEMNSAAASIGLTAIQAVELNRALDNLAGAQGMNAVATSASAALDLIAGMFDETENIPPEIALIVQRLQSVLESASAGVTIFGDMGEGIGGAADEAERLARNIALATRGQAILNASRNNPDFFDPRNESGLAGETDENRFNPPLGLPGVDLPPNPRAARGARSRRGGSRGPSQADREMQEMLRERDRILDDLKTAQDRYNDSVSQADRLLAAGVLTQDQYNEHLRHLKLELDEVQFEKLHQGIDSISDAIGGAIARGEDLGDAFRGVLQQMAADILSSGIRDLLTNMLDVGSGSGGGGFLGSLFGGLLSFEGGGDTPSGPRSGGLDGRGGFPAILHPNETVIDKTTAGGMARQEVVVRVEPEIVTIGDDGQMMIRIQTVARNTTATGLREYDRNLDGRVNGIIGQNDTRKK